MRDTMAKQKDTKLQLAGALERDTEAKQKDVKCMVMGDSMLSTVGTQHTDMMVECFLEIRTEQLNSDRKERSMKSRNCYYSCRCE
jgi:hypothetical protein